MWDKYKGEIIYTENIFSYNRRVCDWREECNCTSLQFHLYTGIYLLK